MVAREVRNLIEANGFAFKAFEGIGFGPYSLGHKKLFSEATSIKLSNKISNVARSLKADFLFKTATDVNIFIFQKK